MYGWNSISHKWLLALTLWVDVYSNSYTKVRISVPYRKWMLNVSCVVILLKMSNARVRSPPPIQEFDIKQRSLYNIVFQSVHPWHINLVYIYEVMINSSSKQPLLSLPFCQQVAWILLISKIKFINVWDERLSCNETFSTPHVVLINITLQICIT